MNEKKLSAAELRRQLREAEEAEKNDREAYKQVVNETVQDTFPVLKELHEQLKAVKDLVFSNFDHALDLKREIYGVSSTKQHSHTFTNAEGDISIKIGYRTKESYDDTVDAGIEKVNAYLRGLARDKETEALIETIMSLLSKDKEGNLNASRVIQLERIAEKTGNAEFLDGISIIKDAYKPLRTCRFIEAQLRDEDGKWQALPLAISAVD